MSNAPTKILLHKKSKLLELHFNADGATAIFSLPAEFLRVHSPSAEVKGHGHGQEVLQTGKINVGIDKIEMVGNYAIKIIFDDGHDSGIFSWNYLLDLGVHQQTYWNAYLEKLQAASQSRDPSEGVVKFI
jgi:DUF971 family protein